MRKKPLPFLFWSLLGIALSCFWGTKSEARPQDFKKGTMIRDAEIESFVQECLDPLLEAAEIPVESVKFYLVTDSSLNAATGENFQLFLNSGLFGHSERAEEFVGVLAHEIGHMFNGDVALRQSHMQEISTPLMVAGILGAAAGALAGSGEAAAGILAGTMGIGQGHLMGYARSQESLADRAAVQFLEKVEWPIEGFANTLRTLGRQEYLTTAQQDLYQRTHPFSQNRLLMLQEHSKNQKNAHLPSSLSLRFQRVKAKLRAFLNTPSVVIRDYPGTSITDRYARTIALWREGHKEKALEMLQSLLEENPQDAYFWELQGQILFEEGHLEEALISHTKAQKLLPNEPLFHLNVAQTLLELQGHKEANTQKALLILKEAQHLAPKNPFVWQLSAVAYGRLGHKGEMALSLAEKAHLLGQTDQVESQGNRALALLAEDSPLKNRAKDLIEVLNQ
ncbi:MAG: M48 family metalloprotease [bacterium]|nr:M48 family metalloprotease [bacterium]